MTIREEMQQWADARGVCFLRRDLDACVDLYTDDGAIFSPYGAPAKGRAEIRRVHTDWMAAGEVNKRIDILEARQEGPLAYCVAACSGDFPDGNGGQTTEPGVSVNIAMRHRDRGWRMHISSLNSDTPPLANL